MTETSKLISLSLIALMGWGLAACGSTSNKNMSVVKKSNLIVMDKDSERMGRGEYTVTTRETEENPAPYIRGVTKSLEPRTVAFFKSAFTKPKEEPETDELKQLEGGVNNSKYLYYSKNPLRIGRIRLKRFK